ncbi:NUDIX hydrolase [Actinomyces vulturis]|uniref:NUDIX hydrolase n=1 Tax=Actinomyces vulturis TaxID=1857645 RepID=UPI00082CA95A|nr:NUDIX hydrolase [Actinomyces vulturis]
MKVSEPTVIRAAGAVVWRRHGRGIDILVVHRPSRRDWSLPKGKVDPGESLPACAVREIAEETGYDVTLGMYLGIVSYRLPSGKKKEVTYYAATLVEDDAPYITARPHAHRAPASEIDDVQWLPIKEARRILTYSRDRRLLNSVADLLDQGALKTRTVIITRHARATKRTQWLRRGDGKEETRPITAHDGNSQSEALVPLLAAYGPTQVISSPWLRCIQTIEPYCQASGVPLKSKRYLTEAAHRKNARTAYRLLKKLLDHTASCTVLCTHRPVLPSLFDAIEPLCTSNTRGDLPRKDPWLKTAESIVISVAKPRGKMPRVMSIERVRPVNL